MLPARQPRTKATWKDVVLACLTGAAIGLLWGLLVTTTGI